MGLFSLFSSPATATGRLQQVQRSMWFQMGWAILFALVNVSRNHDPRYYPVAPAAIAAQLIVAAGVGTCAYGIGKRLAWALPATYIAEALSLMLAVYALTSIHSGFVAGYLIAILVLVRISNGEAQALLKAGPGGVAASAIPGVPGMYAPGQFGQQPYAPPPGFAQPGFAQPAYQQPGFQQPAYQQPAYQQPTAPMSAPYEPAYTQPGPPPQGGPGIPPQYEPAPDTYAALTQQAGWQRAGTILPEGGKGKRK